MALPIPYCRKRKRICSGEYPTLSLAEARAEHDKARALVKQAIHPAHQRQLERMASHSANANTFEAVAREWIDKKSSDWTPYYLRQVERFFAADVFPPPLVSCRSKVLKLLTCLRSLNVLKGEGRRRLLCWSGNGHLRYFVMPLQRFEQIAIQPLRSKVRYAVLKLSTINLCRVLKLRILCRH
nr:integrase arm-type DNA-binding domain-containing protein [Pectobacterium sp. PL152]